MTTPATPELAQRPDVVEHRCELELRIEEVAAARPDDHVERDRRHRERLRGPCRGWASARLRAGWRRARPDRPRHSAQRPGRRCPRHRFRFMGGALARRSRLHWSCRMSIDQRVIAARLQGATTEFTSQLCQVVVDMLGDLSVTTCQGGTADAAIYCTTTACSTPSPRRAAIARALYAGVKDLPLVSPHGHTDPRWYAENETFPDPAQLLIVPDHYVFRMLLFAGHPPRGPRRADDRRLGGRDRRPDDLAAVRRELLPVPRHADAACGSTTRSRRCSASTERLTAEECRRDLRPDRRAAAARRVPAARAVRALQSRGDLDHRRAIDELKWHKMIRDSGWKGRVVPAYRPDCGGRSRFRRLCRRISTGSARSPASDTGHWAGYLDAHRKRARSTSRRSARPRPTTATRPPRPPNLAPKEAGAAVRQGAHRQGRRGASGRCSAPRC